MFAKNSFDLYFPRVPFREYIDSHGWLVDAGDTMLRAWRYNVSANTVFLLDRIYVDVAYGQGFPGVGNARGRMQLRLYCPESTYDYLFYSYVPDFGYFSIRDLGILFSPNSSFTISVAHAGAGLVSGVGSVSSFVIIGRYYNNDDLQELKYSNGQHDQYAGIVFLNINIPG